MENCFENDGNRGAFFPSIDRITGGYPTVVDPEPAWGLVCRERSQLVVSSRLPQELREYFCRLSVSSHTADTFDQILVEMDDNESLRADFIRFSYVHYQSIVAYFMEFKNLAYAQTALAIANMMLRRIKPLLEFEEYSVTANVKNGVSRVIDDC